MQDKADEPTDRGYRRRPAKFRPPITNEGNLFAGGDGRSPSQPIMSSAFIDRAIFEVSNYSIQLSSHHKLGIIAYLDQYMSIERAPESLRATLTLLNRW